MSSLVKRLIACLQGEGLEIQGHLALELAATVDFSGLSALKPYNPVTLCRVLRRRPDRRNDLTQSLTRRWYAFSQPHSLNSRTPEPKRNAQRILQNEDAVLWLWLSPGSRRSYLVQACWTVG